ncbi:MAG: toll/interleukin-1 receptor domain-containing protein [Alphaproteobacteria bacterium]|nr:toll/interleukin-1 receptor domain-containing protein [Alphaproteobacteria bacterium]
MTDKTFVSYRRSDSPGSVRQLCAILKKRLYPRDIFIDIDGIAPGSDFTEILDKSLNDCGAFLVIIGPHWLDERDHEGKRRLDNEDDYVRLEVATALRRNIPVIPVLVDGAELPTEDRLPLDLRPLVHRQTLELSHQSFDQDARHLAQKVKEVLPELETFRKLWFGLIIALVFTAVFAIISWFILSTHWYIRMPIAAVVAYPLAYYLYRRTQRRA